MNSVQVWNRLFVLIVCGILLQACNHCPKQADPLPYYPIAGDLSDFGKFEVGTYWIYQNDSTLSIDSIAIDSIVEGKQHPVGNFEDCYKEIIVAEIDLRKEFFSLNQNGFTQLMLWGTEQLLLFGTPINTWPYSPELYLIYGESCNDTTYCKFLDSLKVLNQLYYDVMVTRSKSCQLDDMDSTNYYLARNMGLVKKVVFQPSGYVESWSLAHSKIIQ